MTLTERQKKHLRGLGHSLKPTIMVGDSGVTEAVFAEYESTIDHHELIKIKVRVGDRRARDTIISQLCDKSGAILVQRIGNIALLYKQNPEKKKIRI
ncbi:MAG: ribosome assembly RNA-binding protein YhbY [Woeseiaceae bacterium]|nr:ribosome assembly RNA-binding protein YhbY [Woeseiaceae bacterium]